MKRTIKALLLGAISAATLGPMPGFAQELTFPRVPPAEAPILENSFRLDTSSGLWLRPLAVSGSFSKSLIDPDFALKNYKEVGIDENRRLQLIDLVANASADMTRTEHLTADVNTRLNELLAAKPINAEAVKTAFEKVLERENSLKRIRFEMMIEATSLLSVAEIEALQDLRASKSRVLFERWDAELAE